MRKIVGIYTILLLLLFSNTIYSQSLIKGKIVDAETNEPLIGAAIVVEGTSQGVTSDIDGNFSFHPSNEAGVLKFSFVGYQDFMLRYDASKRNDLGVVELSPSAIGLSEVSVMASLGIARRTPVAISTITPQFIEEKMGTLEFPELLKSTPGVYATKGPGGFGDSKINMRGFQSPNVAVMVNGIPMNDMEWGGLYWSNWAGLSDVTSIMQTQRGLGASKVSAPSVGGSINIVTKSLDAKQGGSVSYYVGNDGYNKVVFTVSTGMNEKGWAMTLLGGKTWGEGYVQGADFEGYNYFVNIAKKMNDNHQLSFTAFAAPQWHYQRNSNDGLSIVGWQQAKKYMKDDSPYKYNPTYGFGLNGERKSSSYNEYHKPQISLNHIWDVNEKSNLSTALYTSLGRGYGYSGQGTSDYSSAWYGSSNGTLNMGFRNDDGTFNYAKVYDINAASDHGSEMVMSKSKNHHNWFGLVSTYTTSLWDDFDLYGGVDFRYYQGIHTNEIVDLYGGDYYIDRNRRNVKVANNSAAGTLDFNNKKLSVGDVVYRDYDGFVMQEGAFGQIEYNKNKLSSFVAASVSNSSYWRYDRFYYDSDNSKSTTENFLGYTVKGGANYNLNIYHNLFANVGYISRAPFYSGGVFLNSAVSNATNPNAVNEKIFSIEAGYGFKTRSFNANLNLYRTMWMDKTMTRSYDLKDGSRASINMEGVDALHQGIELEVVAKPLSWLDITGMLSIGDWRWNSDATGYFYNDTGQPIANADGDVASDIGAEDHASMTLNLKDVKVGGSAQTTGALGTRIKWSKDLRIGADYNLFYRNFADWSFSSNDLILNGEKTYESPWEIPGASLVDVFASYAFPIGSTRAILSGNVNNLLNQEYIADAYDGASHDWDTAYRVFYGFGRTYSIRLKINF